MFLVGHLFVKERAGSEGIIGSQLQGALEVRLRAGPVADAAFRFAAVAESARVVGRYFDQSVGRFQVLGAGTGFPVPVAQIAPTPEIVRVLRYEGAHLLDGDVRLPALRLDPGGP